MSNDYNAGFEAGQRGSLFGAPATAEGTAGFMAGQQAASTRYTGSMEWLVAPFVLWPFVLIFYPVGGLATVLTALVAEQVARALGLSGGLTLLIVLGTTIPVCWTLVRREQFWGMQRSYARARHVVRLLILALLMNGGATNAWRTAHDLPALPGWEATYAWPPQWMAVALCLVLWELLFRRAYQLRIYWNTKLKQWRFRPASFEPFYQSWKNTVHIVEAQAPIEMPRRRFQ